MKSRLSIVDKIENCDIVARTKFIDMPLSLHGLGRFHIFSKALRVTDWWSCKAIPFSALACVSYIHTYGYIEPFRMLYFSGLLLLSISGCAVFGMVLNDWCDRENDIKAGRPSIVGSLSLHQVLVFLCLSLLLIFLPLVHLPGATAVAILAIVECILLAAYSVSPIRLKDRGGWGVMTDSLYAHVLPALAAWFAFSSITPRVSYLWMIGSSIILVIWQFPMGFRGLLGHQINDYAKDKDVGEQTLAVQIGVERSQEIIRLYLIPTEVIATVLIFSIVQLPNLISLIGLVLFSVAWILHLNDRVSKHKTLKRLPTARNIAGQVMRIFWAEWFSLSVFISIVAVSHDFWPTLIIYILLRPMLITHFAHRIRVKSSNMMALPPCDRPNS